MTSNYGPPGPAHIVFYRQGELCLFLEPLRRNPHLDLDVLRNALKGARIRRRGGDPLNARYPLGSRPLTIQRGNSEQQQRTVRTLQVVNLASWQESQRRATLDSVTDVCTAARHLNERISADGIRLGDYILRAAGPNWLAHPMDWWGCGCPDDDASLWPAAPLRFPPDAAASEVRKTLSLNEEAPTSRGNDVNIAILDTWPVDPPGPHYKLSKIAAAAVAQGNPRLADFASGKIIPEGSIHDDYVTGRSPSVYASFINRNGDFLPRFDVADHGLFVADILSDLASGDDPRSGPRLSVYRVLDDRGCGDLVSVARAVQDAINDPMPRSKLVINLSLGFAPVPVVLDMVLGDQVTPFKDPDKWADQRLDQLQAKRQMKREISARDDMTAMALRYVFDLANEPNVIAVAAAGNDASPNRVVGPRFPANLEGVIGVSSVKQGGRLGATISEFSNLDDLVSPDDGVPALGEDVVGVHTRHGWASWSGTSFATPVVSAMTALLWDTMASPTRQKVIEAVVRDPTDPTNPAKQRHHFDIFQV